VHHPDLSVVRVSQHNERNIKMNHTNWGMMDGWWGGGMWMGGGLALIIVILLIVLLGRK